MRFHLLLASLLVSGLAARSSPAESAPKPIVHLHSLGAEQVAALPGATQLKTVTALPETQALRQHILQRLARSPVTWSGGAIAAPAVETTAARVESMLQTLGQKEFALDVFPQGDNGYGFLLVCNLGNENLAGWRANLTALAEAWQLGPTTEQTIGDVSALVLGAADASHRTFWAESGSWGLLGVGPAGLAALRDAAAEVGRTQRPLAPLTEGWLSLEADLGRLTGPLGLPADKPWPRIGLTQTSEEANVRTTGRIEWPQAMTGPVEPWNVPTNLMFEPLNSFSAARGMNRVLGQSDLWRKLQIDPVPNRWFAWAQSAVSGQFNLAFPWPSAGEHLAELASTAPSLLPEALRSKGLTNFAYVAAESAVVWRGIVPVVVPKLSAADAGGQVYALLSLFPTPPGATPPAELLGQLERPDLLYYGWEITGVQIEKLLTVTQLAALLGDHRQLNPERPPLRWLLALSRNLGNTATELVRRSDREWTFSRKSHLGLAATELLLLTHWLESAEFPRPGLEVMPGAEPSRRELSPPRARPPGAPRPSSPRPKKP